MVYLGGPQFRRRQQLRLHDAPPGYRPPRMPGAVRRRELRQDQVLLRVATVVAAMLVTALVVLCAIVIATRA
jgi:hypothetical protein